MSYSINISLKGKDGRAPRHVCRTERNSVFYEEEAVALARRFERAFPPDDYEISISRVETISTPVYYERGPLRALRGGKSDE